MYRHPSPTQRPNDAAPSGHRARETRQVVTPVNQRCEQGCGRRAITVWWDENRDIEWWLCGWHSDAFALALVQQGYQQVEDERRDDIHPGLGPVTANPATH